MVYTKAYNARMKEGGQHIGPVTRAFMDVLRALLYSFHNERDGRCFPSYERIAEAANCARSTVYGAIRALESAGVLTWVNRLTKIRVPERDLFGRIVSRWQVIRTSNSYRFHDPKAGGPAGTGAQRRHFVERDVGDLSGMSAAWMSFNHKRENLDDGGDRVYFKVYKDGVWYLLDQFQGPGNDLGEHAGNYYDLTPYISSDLRIMFETENQSSMRDGDRVKFDNFNIFAWSDRAPASASMR